MQPCSSTVSSLHYHGADKRKASLLTYTICDDSEHDSNCCRAVEADFLNAAAHNALGLIAEGRSSYAEASGEYQLAIQLASSASGCISSGNFLKQCTRTWNEAQPHMRAMHARCLIAQELLSMFNVKTWMDFFRLSSLPIAKTDPLLSRCPGGHQCINSRPTRATGLVHISQTESSQAHEQMAAKQSC